jgi:hypothetical protein
MLLFGLLLLSCPPSLLHPQPPLLQNSVQTPLLIIIIIISILCADMAGDPSPFCSSKLTWSFCLFPTLAIAASCLVLPVYTSFFLIWLVLILPTFCPKGKTLLFLA